MVTEGKGAEELRLAHALVIANVRVDNGDQDL